MASAEDLRYRLPPDMLHFEPKYFFGLGVTDLMIATMPSMLAMQVGGVLLAVIVAVLMLAGLMRFERFGNRSVLTYAGLWLWHKYRPSTVILPRIMPRQDAKLEVTTWAGDPLYTIEVED